MPTRHRTRTRRDRLAAAVTGFTSAGVGKPVPLRHTTGQATATARQDHTMSCPNCGDQMDGPATILGRAHPHDHWNCDTCGAELTIPLPDTADADRPTP